MISSLGTGRCRRYQPFTVVSVSRHINLKAFLNFFFSTVYISHFSPSTIGKINGNGINAGKYEPIRIHSLHLNRKWAPDGVQTWWDDSKNLFFKFKKFKTIPEIKISIHLFNYWITTFLQLTLSIPIGYRCPKKIFVNYASCLLHNNVQTKITIGKQMIFLQ